jgi:hypothetical protein
MRNLTALIFSLLVSVAFAQDLSQHYWTYTYNESPFEDSSGDIITIADEDLTVLAGFKEFPDGIHFVIADQDLYTGDYIDLDVAITGGPSTVTYKLRGTLSGSVIVVDEYPIVMIQNMKAGSKLHVRYQVSKYRGQKTLRFSLSGFTTNWNKLNGIDQ